MKQTMSKEEAKEKAIEHLEEHKELHKQIYGCICKPLTNKAYCTDCQGIVIGFMNKFGAGALTQDIRIGRLQKEIKQSENNNKDLKNQLSKTISKKKVSDAIEKVWKRVISDEYDTITPFTKFKEELKKELNLEEK